MIIALIGCNMKQDAINKLVVEVLSLLVVILLKLPQSVGRCVGSVDLHLCKSGVLILGTTLCFPKCH